MRNNQNKVVVPVAALRPLLQKWVAKNSRENRWGDKINKGMNELSEETGINIRRLCGILNDSMPHGAKNVTFDIADKLLCAMQMNSEWHSSLAEYYVELEVAPYEVGRVGGRRKAAA